MSYFSTLQIRICPHLARTTRDPKAQGPLPASQPAAAAVPGTLRQTHNFRNPRSQGASDVLVAEERQFLQELGRRWRAHVVKRRTGGSGAQLRSPKGPQAGRLDRQE